MATIVKAAVTIFKESKAFKINKKINPKEITEEKIIFLKNKLKVKVDAKNRGRKKERSWVILAEVILSG